MRKNESLTFAIVLQYCFAWLLKEGRRLKIREKDGKFSPLSMGEYNGQKPTALYLNCLKNGHKVVVRKFSLGLFVSGMSRLW